MTSKSDDPDLSSGSGTGTEEKTQEDRIKVADQEENKDEQEDATPRLLEDDDQGVAHTELFRDQAEEDTQSFSPPQEASSSSKSTVKPSSADGTKVAADPAPPAKKKELKGGMTPTLLFSVIVCTVGSSFQFGYAIGVMNAPEQDIKNWMNETTDYDDSAITTIWAATVAIFAVGGVFGALMSGMVADRLGRKNGMLANNLLALLAAALQGSAKISGTIWLLTAGRLVTGINCGLSTGLAPMYLTEIGPVSLRGCLGSTNQLVVTVSILLSQIMGLRQLLGNAELWWMLFAFVAVPAIFQLALLPLCPESPKYNLISRNKRTKAEKDLMKLRKLTKQGVAPEVEVMQKEADDAKLVPKVKFTTMFKDAALRWPLFIAVMMMLSQQFCGINAIGPVSLRGCLGSTNQLVVTVSILLSQIMGLRQLLGNAELWWMLFAFVAVPAIFQLALLPLCPESPKYNLISRNKRTKAEKDLMKLRKLTKQGVAPEVEVMQKEADDAKLVPKVKFTTMFKDAALRWPLFIAVMMMLSQQFCGINAAMFYSTSIFKSAGLEDDTARYATVGMGVLNVLVSILAMWLVDHPRFGRRSLHLIGLAGMWYTSILIVMMLSLQNAGQVWASYLCIIFVLAFVASFAVVPGPIPWFFVSELFTQGSRGHASSIACCTNWAATFLVGLLFPIIQDELHQYTFLIFTACTTVFLVFTYKWVPETKGIPVEEIVKQFQKRAVDKRKLKHK